MTRSIPPPFDADPAKLPPMADPRSDRKEAYVSLRAEQPRSEPGMVLDFWNEIRQILSDFEGHCEDAAQPKGGSSILVRSAPTVDEPGKEGAAVLFAHTPPQPAGPPSRRNGTARAVLAVAGLALLGAMSLVVVRGPELFYLAASVLAKGAPRAGDRPAAVARAVLPPARTVTVAKNDASRLPTGAPKYPAAAFGTAATSWTNPLPAPRTPTAAPANPPAPHARAEAQQPDGGFARSPITVAQWNFRSGNREIALAGGHMPAGQRLTLRIILDGNAAAAEQIRIHGSIAIEVRWTRETSDAAPGAPNLVTQLTIGNRGLADRLAAEAHHTGFFTWHTWAWERSLSPGIWDVSLTYPNGQLLACGNPPSPCRFHIAIG